jgi:hypothetical protein
MMDDVTVWLGVEAGTWQDVAAALVERPVLKIAAKDARNVSEVYTLLAAALRALGTRELTCKSCDFSRRKGRNDTPEHICPETEARIVLLRADKLHEARTGE